MAIKLLTKEQFLERYPISEFALNQEIKAGELFVVKIQGEVLIPEEDAKLWYATAETIAHFECGDKIHAQRLKSSNVKKAS